MYINVLSDGRRLNEFDLVTVGTSTSPSQSSRTSKGLTWVGVVVRELLPDSESVEPNLVIRLPCGARRGPSVTSLELLLCFEPRLFPMSLVGSNFVLMTLWLEDCVHSPDSILRCRWMLKTEAREKLNDVRAYFSFERRSILSRYISSVARLSLSCCLSVNFANSSFFIKPGPDVPRFFQPRYFSVIFSLVKISTYRFHVTDILK